MNLQKILDTKCFEIGAFEFIEEYSKEKGIRIFRFVDIKNNIKARVCCDAEDEPRIIVEELFYEGKLARRSINNITETFANGELIARQILNSDGSSVIERFQNRELGADNMPALTILNADGENIVESWYEGIREGNYKRFGLRNRKPKKSNGVFEYYPAHIERNIESGEQREYYFRADELIDPPNGQPAVVVRSINNPNEIFSKFHFFNGKLGHPFSPAIISNRGGVMLSAHIHDAKLVQPSTGSAIKIEKENVSISYNVNQNGKPESRIVAIDLSTMPEIGEEDKEKVLGYLRESLRSYIHEQSQKNESKIANSENSENSESGSWENFNSI